MNPVPGCAASAEAAPCSLRGALVAHSTERSKDQNAAPGFSRSPWSWPNQNAAVGYLRVEAVSMPHTRGNEPAPIPLLGNQWRRLPCCGHHLVPAVGVPLLSACV